MSRFLLWSFVWVWQIVGVGTVSQNLMADTTTIDNMKHRFAITQDPLTDFELDQLETSVRTAEDDFQYRESISHAQKVDQFYDLIQKPFLDVARLREWREKMILHHDKLDQLLILRMAYVVEKAYGQILRKKERVFPTLSFQARSLLEESWERLIGEHAKWRKDFDSIGPRAIAKNETQPQLPVRDRVYGQDNFLREVHRFSQMLNTPPSRVARVAKRVANGAAFPFLCLGAGVGCGLLSVGLLGAKATQGVGAFFYQKSIIPAPGPSVAMGLLRSMKGKELGVKDRHNLLLDSQGPNDVRLYLPPHLNEWADLVALSALQIPNPRAFANAGIVGTIALGNGYAGRLLGGFAARMEGVVPVGKVKGFFRNESTALHYIRELKKPGTANFFNFSQGFVNRECIPISPRFVEGLLLPPLTLGKKLTLIPLSFHQPNEFLAKAGTVEKKPGPDITVHRPIPFEAIQKLFALKLTETGKLSGLTLIPLVIRQMWYTTMQDDLSVAELKKRIDALFLEGLSEEEETAQGDSSSRVDEGEPAVM